MIGGVVAFILGAPMPFLLGGVVGSLLFVGLYERGSARHLPKLNRYIRMSAIAAVGAMMGASVSADLLVQLPLFWLSALAILPFVIIAHFGGYWIMRGLGRYSTVDAYFASMPGGLVEAVLLGEKAGADVRILTIQHFIRVLSIVAVVPLLFFIFTGEVVGSAAGENLQSGGRYSGSDVALIVAIAAVGLLIGRFIRLPASHLLGPLLLAIVLSVGGIVSVSVPPWMLHGAQYLVGVTLGAQFAGINGAMLRKGFGLGAVTVSYMLVLGLGFGWVLSHFVPASVPAMFISFAAGGLTEMSLIALSLDLSPLTVAIHHLIRIFLTIWVGNGFYRRYLQR